MDSISLPLPVISGLITLAVQLLKHFTPLIKKELPGLTPFLPVIISGLLFLVGGLGEGATPVDAGLVGVGSSWFHSLFNGFVKQMRRWVGGIL